MKPFLAVISPVVSGAHPDHELPTPPAGAKPPAGPVDPGYGISIERPSHPIFYPLPPGAPVDPSYGIPEDGPPRPDNTLPGAQPKPEHPIVLPPDTGGGWLPVYIWGPGDARPTPPIVLPPDGEAPPEAGGGKVEWKALWTPSGGWQTVGVIVPDKPVPTPSKRK